MSFVAVVVTLVIVPVARVYPPVTSSVNKPVSAAAAVPAPVPQPTYKGSVVNN